MQELTKIMHLYLGCEVKIDDYYHNLYGNHNKAYISGVSNGLYNIDFYERLANGVEMCITDEPLMLSVKEIKPILYSLSDLTEEHAKEFQNITNCEKEDLDIFKGGTFHLSTINDWAFGVQYLLSKGYWLFGDEAFDKGDIIDKKTI